MRVILKISGGHYHQGNSHPKFLKSTHSPTAILRILFKKSAFFCHCERSEAIHTSKLESSVKVDCHDLLAQISQ